MSPIKREKYPKDWDKISAWIRRERGNVCEYCGNGPLPKNPLTVHHKNYDPMYNAPQNLIVLCAKCHLKVHAYNLLDPHQKQFKFMSQIHNTGKPKPNPNQGNGGAPLKVGGRLVPYQH